MAYLNIIKFLKKVNGRRQVQYRKLFDVISYEKEVYYAEDWPLVTIYSEQLIFMETPKYRALFAGQQCMKS